MTPALAPIILIIPVLFVCHVVGRLILASQRDQARAMKTLRENIRPNRKTKRDENRSAP